MTNETGASIYAVADEMFDRGTGGNTGYETLIGTSALTVSDAAVQAWRDRYAVIKAYQKAVIRVFRESLSGQRDPRIAQMVLSDLPESQGAAWHAKLTDQHLQTPAFFRTDEPSPGRCSEIQCPGAGWDLAELLWNVAQAFPAEYPSPRHFAQSPATGFADALRSHLDAAPVVHHLVDNASRPHGMRYWIQQTRAAGVQYFGYDRHVEYGQCNFVRSHDYVSLLNHNFYAERMDLCAEGRLAFDLPPCALFDGKVIMAWPFWSVTRDAFTDAMRALLPYTSLIDHDGIVTADGEALSFADYLELPPSRKNAFIKYAGTDVGINWGSRAVYRADTLSRGQRADLLDRIQNDHRVGRYWVLQEALQQKDTIAYWTRTGDIEQMEANAKWSAFYGPTGLMGLLAFHQAAHKVHGGTATVCTVMR
jgi:hypothetical protein